MKSHFGLIFLVFFVFFLPNLAIAEGFYRDLRLGDTGEDIRQLQIFLNHYSQIQVASVGPGSPGKETSYFGPRTEQAVIRFQEKNATDILHPLGLFQGTGFVGPSTRRILNNQSGFTVTLPASPAPIIDEFIPTTPPIINLPATSENPKTESVLILPSIIDHPSDLMGNIMLDANLDFSFFANLDWHAPPPSKTMRLEKITPNQGKSGTVITIEGIGFLTTNDIHVGYDRIRGIKSDDGKILSLNIHTPPDWQNTGEKQIIPLWIYVENKTGLSNNLIFNLEL